MEDTKFVLELVRQGGFAAAAGLFATVWWLERKERIKAQEQKDKMAIAMLKAFNRSTNALRALRSVWLKGHDPLPEEYEPESIEEILGGGNFP